jgi:hypothetical protein
MAKIIRLTESDLVRLVNRVIEEQKDGPVTPDQNTYRKSQRFSLTKIKVGDKFDVIFNPDMNNVKHIDDSKISYKTREGNLEYFIQRGVGFSVNGGPILDGMEQKSEFGKLYSLIEGISWNTDHPFRSSEQIFPYIEEKMRRRIINAKKQGNNYIITINKLKDWTGGVKNVNLNIVVGPSVFLYRPSNSPICLDKDMSNIIKDEKFVESFNNRKLYDK